jgi:hypothetical protein
MLAGKDSSESAKIYITAEIFQSTLSYFPKTDISVVFFGDLEKNIQVPYKGNRGRRNREQQRLIQCTYTLPLPGNISMP